MAGREYGKATVSKYRGKWRATVRVREVESVVNDDGTVTETKGPWRQLTKMTTQACVIDPEGTPKDKRNNRNKQKAQDEADAWRASLIQEEADVVTRRAEIEARKAQEAAERAEAERLAAENAKRKTVGEFISAQLDSMHGYVEESTIKGYRYQEKLVAEEFGDVLLCDLTADMVREWENKLKAKYSAVTVRKCHAFLKARMEEAVDEGQIERIPFTRKMKPPKLEHKEPNALDTQGRARVLALLDGNETSIGIAAQIAIYTGMRRGEICGLTWQNVTIDRDEEGEPCGGTITVSQAVGVAGASYIKQTKTNRVRYIPMHAELAKILAKRKAAMQEECMCFGVPFKPALYVIGDAEGNHRAPDAITREWTVIAKTCGIKGTQGEICTFHDLRHTWATAAIREGSDVKSVSAVLGHASAKMTLDVYASAESEAMRDAVKRVGDSMQGGKAEADVIKFKPTGTE